MHCNSKARQSIKVEKENENIKLRKKIKSLTTDKHLANKKETVWDRLSKVKKAPSTENVLGVMRSRPSIISKTSQRFQTFKQIPLNPPIQLLRKPLSPKTSSNNKPSNAPNKFCFQKPSIASETEKQTFLDIEPIKEIMTARSFSGDSKSLLESKICFSEDSNEEYELAPLMNYSDSRSSMEILNKVREFLQQQKKSMTLEDIELIKDVIKSDCRYRNLDQNPDLFKEILKTQLQSTLKHEFAIKKVLDCLESSASLDLNLQIESDNPINKIVSYSGNNNAIQKFEVDIIFKNVPSLDKEIEILRALGEKLEATLRSSTYLRKKHDYIKSHETVSTQSIAEGRNRPIRFKLRHELYVSTAEYYAEVSVHQIGIRLHVGIVNEFYMAQKTIVELKQESNRPFYIPSNSESLQLKRTCFEKLKETPSELLRYLKPKNSKIAFNILEQDPVFFNNLFNKSLKLCSVRNDLSKNYYYTEEDQLMTFKDSLCEGGDSVLWDLMKDKAHTNFTKALIVKNNSNYKALRDITTLSNNFDPPIRCKQRRRIRRYLTPMPISTCCNPKNALFKTVLVGIVQMSVFIIFIMALTYPDVRC